MTARRAASLWRGRLVAAKDTLFAAGNHPGLFICLIRGTRYPSTRFIYLFCSSTQKIPRPEICPMAKNEQNYLGKGTLPAWKQEPDQPGMTFMAMFAIADPSVIEYLNRLNDGALLINALHSVLITAPRDRLCGRRCSSGNECRFISFLTGGHASSKGIAASPQRLGRRRNQTVLFTPHWITGRDHEHHEAHKARAVRNSLGLGPHS